MMPNYLSTLPQFLGLYLVGGLLLTAFWSLYTFITPHRELALIRAGNLSAALMLAGAMLGYAMPVAVALARSNDVYQLAQWGAVAMVVQLLTYAAQRLLQRDLHEAICQDRLSVALWAATLSISMGLLNAGAQFVEPHP